MGLLSDRRVRTVAGAAIVAMIAAPVGAFLRYRSQFPKPHPFCGAGTGISIRTIRIPSGAGQLYAEVMIPDDGRPVHPCIVCSHGYNGSYRFFRNGIGPSMAMSGYVVCCFDFYAGSVHGKSGGSTREMSVFDEKRQLEDVFTFMKSQGYVDSERMLLWGESQGGFVSALAAAELGESVSALALFYPAFCITDDMLARFGSPEEVPELLDHLGVPISRRYYEGLFGFDAYAQATRYEGPVLIVHGDADRTVDVSYGERAQRAYADARLEILPGEDHGFSARGRMIAAEKVFRFFEQVLCNQDSERISQ